MGMRTSGAKSIFVFKPKLAKAKPIVPDIEEHTQSSTKIVVMFLSYEMMNIYQLGLHLMVPCYFLSLQHLSKKLLPCTVLNLRIDH